MDLYYIHVRYFSAHLGRFQSVDPVGAAPSWPQSWNRYGYVLGNPMKYTDPDGRQQLSVLDEISVVGELIPLPGHPVSHGVMEAIVIASFLRDLAAHRNRRESRAGSGNSSDNGWFWRAIAGCPPWTAGVSFDVSTINPFTSGGGGTIFGANLQHVPGEGLGINTYSTPHDQSSVGFDLGASLTANAGFGSGPWTGDSVVSMANIGVVTFGGFGSPEAQLSDGWYGLQGGVSGPIPFGAGSTSVTYTNKFDISFLAPGCY